MLDDQEPTFPTFASNSDPEEEREAGGGCSCSLFSEASRLPPIDSDLASPAGCFCGTIGATAVNGAGGGAKDDDDSGRSSNEVNGSLVSAAGVPNGDAPLDSSAAVPIDDDTTVKSAAFRDKVVPANDTNNVEGSCNGGFYEKAVPHGGTPVKSAVSNGGTLGRRAKDTRRSNVVLDSANKNKSGLSSKAMSCGNYDTGGIRRRHKSGAAATAPNGVVEETVAITVLNGTAHSPELEAAPRSPPSCKRRMPPPPQQQQPQTAPQQQQQQSVQIHINSRGEVKVLGEKESYL